MPEKLRRDETVSPGGVPTSGPAFASRRNAAIALLAVAGMGVAAYLTYIHYRGGEFFCGGLGNCDYVNSSTYAVLFGVPIALLGFLVYAAILGAALISARSTWSAAITIAPLAVFAFSFGGVLFSAYLTYVELYVLHAV